MNEQNAFMDIINTLPELIAQQQRSLNSANVPVTANINGASTDLPEIPSKGLGTFETFNHLQSAILPNLAQGHAGPRYFGIPISYPADPGFVTGGVTPVALLADYLVSTYDQNVQVHLPQSISTTVERQTINMLCQLLGLQGFKGTLTTGATAGNILGLACGREATVLMNSGERVSQVGAKKVVVLYAGGHSSVSKACSILGIGRQNCADITSDDHPASFDLVRLTNQLMFNQMLGIGSIVVATYGEINTGAFPKDMDRVVELCTEYNAWLHIDAAFGVLARIHPTHKQLSRHLELANSIAFDGHKFFNVPYDCGIFLTRDISTLTEVCGNIGAAYLSLPSSDEDPSPLNISLENSRRFRALPLYASLMSLGVDGYTDLVVRCCSLATGIGEEIEKSQAFRLLWKVEFNIVLFQARGFESIEANLRLRDAINGSGKMYLSSTAWKGEGALRIAICNHLIPSNSTDEARQILTILEEAVHNLSPA